METITALMKTPTLKQQCSDDKLQQIVALTYFRKGQPIEPQALSLVASDFKSLLLRHFSYLTIEEVGYALENGVFGKYGQVYTISVAMFNQWITDYTTSEERIHAWESARKLSLPEKATITEEEKHNMVRKFIIDKFLEYSETRKFSDNFGLIYDRLSSIGILTPTQDEKNKIYREYLARELELSKTRKPRGVMSFAQVTEWRTKDARNRATHQSKDYFVKKFFDDVISNGNEITDYV